MTRRKASDLDLDEDVFRHMVDLVVDELVATGQIQTKGKTRKQVEREAAPIISRLNRRQAKIVSMTDYRESLLKGAGIFYRNDELGIACALFATWLEHLLNGMLGLQLKREHRFSEDAVSNVIRSASVDAKITWLLRLSGLPAIAASHVSTIKKLNELRNAFVHYKWKAVDVDSDDPFESELEETLKKFKKSITYLKRYERKHIYGGLPSPDR